MSEAPQYAGRSAAPPHSQGGLGHAAASAAIASAAAVSATAVSALATAAVASLLASSCCFLPLLLVSLGLSGAWLGDLRILQPYSPILAGVAVVALVFAGRSLRRPASCRVGSPASRSFHRVSFWLIAALTLILLVTPLVAPWFY